jgi:ribosome-binding protein aMBF1 (putative translation factor)
MFRLMLTSPAGYVNLPAGEHYFTPSGDKTVASTTREPPTDTSTPGRRIKSRRALLGIAQKELAAKLGLGVTRIWQFETDRAFETMSVGTFMALSAALGCTMDYLAHGGGDAAS